VVREILQQLCHHKEIMVVLVKMLVITEAGVAAEQVRLALTEALQVTVAQVQLLVFQGHL
jgi:hypothetical protein